MLATSEISVFETKRDQDIALLKSLRAQVLDMVVDSRAYSMTLSYEIAKVRDRIDHDLAYCLLARELDR